jgi:hypothetical protein
MSGMVGLAWLSTLALISRPNQPVLAGLMVNDMHPGLAAKPSKFLRSV